MRIVEPGEDPKARPNGALGKAAGPVRVGVTARMLDWAIRRGDVERSRIIRSFPKLPEWEAGTGKPTLRQLERFARTTHTPMGLLLLDEPPDEPLPIPDFRTIGDHPIRAPSANLLDTIYLCQSQQTWYQDYARREGFAELEFVGSASDSEDIPDVADRIRNEIGFDVARRQRLATWQEAYREFVKQVRAAGILVMVTGIVGNNTSRKLDFEEFRGFVLSDKLAPLIFLNGTDSLSARMFTLAHELVHLWLGTSGLSNSSMAEPPEHSSQEHFCNQVAAEMLAPLATVRLLYNPEASVRMGMQQVARRFKVSTLVALRRISDLGGMDRAQYWSLFNEELERLRDHRAKPSPSSNFHRVAMARLGEGFATAVIAATLEGQSSYSTAFQLLGVRKMDTFDKMRAKLGILV